MKDGRLVECVTVSRQTGLRIEGQTGVGAVDDCKTENVQGNACVCVWNAQSESQNLDL